MKIVLLESLGVPDALLNQCARPFVEAGHTFEAYPKDTDPKVQLQRAADADVIMLANMPLTGEVISGCSNLKFIDVAFTGVDHVDLDACRAKGVKVSNAAGYSNQAVAELVICMMLSLLRNVPQVGERCRTGGTKDGLVGSELRGKTVGIVGAGAIGTRTAQLCAAFGCKVLAYKRHVKGDEPDFMTFVSLDELLSQSDIVSLHCPLNDDSRGMINRETIAKMKKGVIIINTARGKIINDTDLANALSSGRVGYAAIDVLAEEPPVHSSPLIEQPHCMVTPHIAWAPLQARRRCMQIVEDNIRAFQQGKPQNVVAG